MRNAIRANIANVVVAVQLDVVAVVRNADSHGSTTLSQMRGSFPTGSRLFGPLGGKSAGKSHASKHCGQPVHTAAPGERAEYPPVFTAGQRDRDLRDRRGWQWRSQRLSTSLLAAFATGIAG